MARRYATLSSALGWAMESCEEKSLTGHYEDIKGNVDPTLTWPAEFETGFYITGLGVLDRHLTLINKVRTRLGEPLFEVAETNVGDYARRDDRPGKSAARQKWRDEYRGLNVEGRKAWREATQKEIDLLLPPHATFAEHVSKFGQKGRKPMLVGLRPFERERRETALLKDSARRSVAAPKIDLMQRVLRLSANSPEVMAKVIGSMSADEAVTAAEQAQDDAVRDALVLHAVQTMR